MQKLVKHLCSTVNSTISITLSVWRPEFGLIWCAIFGSGIRLWHHKLISF